MTVDLAGTRSRSAVRWIAGYGAIASALPYLALKIVWIGGGTLGVADLDLMRQPNMLVLNVLTAGMDIVGITLALAFTHRWGMRIPAWLLLPPMWVATGLLATFVVGVPIAGLLAIVAPALLPRVTGGPVQPWVYALVYTEFAGLGIGLLIAFLLYARTRWSDVFASAPASSANAVDRLQILLANAAAPMAIAIGALYLAWALGATVGLSAIDVASRTIVGSILNGIAGLLTIAAAVGVLALVHRIASVPAWLAVSMAWVGAGSMFGWGLWQSMLVLGETALLQGAQGRAVVNLVGLARLIVGLVIGLVMLVALARRRESDH